MKPDPLNPAIVRKPFYFVRHGQTDANKQKLWCGGDWDIELNVDGHSQARDASEALLSLQPKIDLILSSPMKRALQTSTTLNSKLQKPVIVIEELREWKVGDLDRTPWTTPLLGIPIANWINPPGGESVIQFQQRIENALVKCLSHEGLPLISAHGAVGRILLHLLQIPDRYIDNCKIHRIVPLEGRGTLQWELE